MPTQRLQVRRRYGLLKCARVAVIDWFSVPLKNTIAIWIEFLEASQKSDCFARERNAVWNSGLHLLAWNPGALIFHIDSIPCERCHGSHSKAGGYCEAGRKSEMFGQFFTQPF